MVVHACNSSYAGGGGRKVTIWGQVGQKHGTLPEKQTEKQKDWEVTQGVEHFPSKHKALSSIISIPLKREVMVYTY
jgi:hypothetical protein